MLIRAFILMLLALPAAADDATARLARNAIPIEQALGIVGARYEGRMIAAELDEEDGRAIYEFRWLTPGASVLRIQLDAATGRFLLVDGVGQSEARTRP